MSSRGAVNNSPPATRRTRARHGARAGLSIRPLRGVLCGLVICAALACAALTAPTASAWRVARPAAAPATAPTAATATAQAARVATTTKAPSASFAAPALFPALAPQAGPGPEDVQTYAADCTTPKSVFNLGETVCARYADAPTYDFFALRRVYWVNTVGFIFQPQDVSAGDGTVTFTIPNDAVSTEGFDRRGGWSVNLVSTADGSVRAAAAFTVRDPNNAAADLAVFQLAEGGESTVAAGANINYTVFVANRGPDPAQNVVLNVPVPELSSASASAPGFVSRAQLSGPIFTCADNTTCTIASLPVGAVATFSFVYEAPSGAAAYTVVTDTPTVGSDTADPRASNNATTSYVTVLGTSSAQDCVLECPNDLTVIANTTQDPDGDGGADPVAGANVTFGSAEPSGECGAVSSSHPSGSFFPVGSTLVSSTSASGGSCSFTVTVLPAGGPTISCPANYSTTVDGCEATVAAADLGEPTTTGDGVQVSAERSDDLPLAEPFAAGVTTIKWTATDNVGRTASCTQTVTVTVNDTTAPTVTAPADLTLSTGESGGACGLVVGEAAFGEPTAADGGCAVSISRADVPAGNFFPVGTTTIKWIATDAAGNTAFDTQTITVVEDTPPTVNAPAPTTVSAGASCQVAVPNVVTINTAVPEESTAFDNCTPVTSLVVTQSPAAGTMVGPGAHTITITATDLKGNTRSGSTTFTVVDDTAPTIAAPASVTVGTDATSCSASGVALGSPQVTENCTYTVTNNAPSVFPLGTTTVTWTVTDAGGNTATAAQTVTVADLTPPVINVLGANPATVLLGGSYADAGATATDACTVPVTVNTAGSVNTGAVGTYTLTYTATDAAGNTATATRAVHVIYDFTGFFSPVANLPTFNSVKAGQSIPVKFSLNGNQGLGIMAAGFPASQQINCNSNAPLSELEGTETPGGSTLTYSNGQYHYNWKSEKSWTGQCRLLNVKLIDGTEHTALFKFK